MNNNKVTDERQDYNNMATRLAKCEEDKMRLIQEKNEILKDFNTRMKVHLDEIRLLKDVNEKLQMDLEELRDLCCYLDDDRQKCRRLAKEWQNFGRNISSTLQSNESSHQEEVNSLHLQHKTLIAENRRLKRLCQDLEERPVETNPQSRNVCIRCAQRISFESNRHELFAEHSVTDSLTGADIFHHNGTGMNGYPLRAENSLTDECSPVFSPDQSVFLQDSVPPNGRKKKVSFLEPDEVSESDDDRPKHVPLDAKSNMLKKHLCRGILRNGVKKGSNSLGSTSSSESDSSINNVNRAMQVLEIHTRLQEEKSYKQHDAMKEKDVAVLQEMCNVAWRKLSNEPSNKDLSLSNGNVDDIVYEDLL